MRHRKILFGWLKDVQKSMNLFLDTLCLSYQLVDLSILQGRKIQNFVDKTNLQLLGCTCLLIASKIYESYSAYIPDLSIKSAGGCTGSQIIDKEKEIIFLLRGNILIPSLYSYIIADENKETYVSEKMLNFYLDPDMYTVSMPEFYRKKILGTDIPIKNADVIIV